MQPQSYVTQLISASVAERGNKLNGGCLKMRRLCDFWRKHKVSLVMLTAILAVVALGYCYVMLHYSVIGTGTTIEQFLPTIQVLLGFVFAAVMYGFGYWHMSLPWDEQ